MNGYLPKLTVNLGKITDPAQARGVPEWSIDKPEYKLTPAADGLTCLVSFEGQTTLVKASFQEDGGGFGSLSLNCGSAVEVTLTLDMQ